MSSGQKARPFTSPAGPGQQHQLQLGQGPRRRRPGGDPTRNVWLQSSCGESHVAAEQLQPSLGSSSSNSFVNNSVSRLPQPLQPAAHMPRLQQQLPARQKQQLACSSLVAARTGSGSRLPPAASSYSRRQSGQPRQPRQGSNSPQQQQQTAHRTWAAMPAASATAIRLVSTVLSNPVTSPSLYRARTDSEVFSQLDGEANSPQSSQDQQPGGAPESPPSPASEPSPLEEAPPLITPPPEPDDVLEACLDRIHRKLHAGMYVEDCTRCQDSAT